MGNRPMEMMDREKGKKAEKLMRGSKVNQNKLCCGLRLKRPLGQ